MIVFLNGSKKVLLENCGWVFNPRFYEYKKVTGGSEIAHLSTRRGFLEAADIETTC